MKDQKDRKVSNFEFGRRLTEVLERRQMKNYHIAMECGVGKASISHYTYGVRIPNLAQFMKMARYMNFTNEEIIYILDSFTKQWIVENDWVNRK